MADIPVSKDEKRVDTVPVPGATETKVEQQEEKKPLPGDSAKTVKRQIELVRGNIDEVKIELLSLINTHIFQLLQEQRKTNELLAKQIEANI